MTRSSASAASISRFSIPADFTDSVGLLPRFVSSISAKPVPRPSLPVSGKVSGQPPPSLRPSCAAPSLAVLVAAAVCGSGNPLLAGGRSNTSRYDAQRRRIENARPQFGHRPPLHGRSFLERRARRAPRGGPQFRTGAAGWLRAAHSPDPPPSLDRAGADVRGSAGCFGFLRRLVGLPAPLGPGQHFRHPPPAPRRSARRARRSTRPSGSRCARAPPSRPSRAPWRACASAPAVGGPRRGMRLSLAATSCRPAGRQGAPGAGTRRAPEPVDLVAPLHLVRGDRHRPCIGRRARLTTLADP